MILRRIASPKDLLPGTGRPCGAMIGPKRPRKSRKSRPYVSVSEQPIWFIDGEGQGQFPHVYTFLAAACEDGRTLQTRFAAEGLTTLECLDFLMSIPSGRAFGYSLGYDWTMILTDMALLSPEKAYALVHEDSRSFGPKKEFRSKVLFRDFALDWLNGQVTLCQGPIKGVRKGRETIVGWKSRKRFWDVFRFFGARFTTALENWGVAPREKLERMHRMKAERGKFDQQTPSEVQAYCLEECVYGAKLVRSLIEAHEDVGLRLRSFFGPGSTAKVLLKKLGVSECLRGDHSLPRPLQHAISCAFFGGRFENSIAGPVERTIYAADIASAYPYQISQLPCLTCGKWERVTRDVLKHVERATLACVKVQAVSPKPEAWGTIPWRYENGTISFPTMGGPSWVWRNEALSALKAPGEVRFHEAWVYHCHCAHRPFKDFPGYYNERLAMGKDARGLTLKLGLNSGYGVMVQRKGTRRFRSLVWAGNITSGTRAMILDVLSTMRDPWNLLMVATDAVYSLEPLKLPEPIDLGTGEVAKQKGKQPLGGWEQKEHKRGMFFMRSGVYFPLEPTEKDLKECRARGLSRTVLYRHASAIVEHWHKHARPGHLPPNYQLNGDEKRFIGLKAGFSLAGKARDKIKLRTTGDFCSYGEWLPFKPELSYNPFPKRDKCSKDGFRLLAHHVPGMWEESTGYDPDLKDIDTIRIEEAERIAYDQPNGDIE